MLCFVLFFVIYVCIYVCMYVCMYYMHGWMDGCMYVRMHACMYVCMYVLHTYRIYNVFIHVHFCPLFISFDNSIAVKHFRKLVPYVFVADDAGFDYDSAHSPKDYESMNPTLVLSWQGGVHP